MYKIQRIQNCLPEPLLTEITNFIHNANWKYGWNSNGNMGFSHWNFNISKTGSENGLDISNHISGPASDVWKYLQSTYFPNTVLLRCYANAHTYGIEGYPHTDSKRSHDMTIVLYLNKTWKREWAGETVIFDEDTIQHAEMPKYNSALIFNGNKFHVARGVTRICPEQRLTLMFKFAPIGIDINRDNIQIELTNLGTREIKHSGRNLLSHLLGTYDYLKSINAPTYICNAGAFHSIFGTNIFQHKTLSIYEKNSVMNIIGEESTRLVELFCSLKRPNTLEIALKERNFILTTNDDNKLEVDKQTLFDLCSIECANLLDQDSLNKYPSLKQFWNEIKNK